MFVMMIAYPQTGNFVRTCQILQGFGDLHWSYGLWSLTGRSMINYQKFGKNQRHILMQSQARKNTFIQTIDYRIANELLRCVLTLLKHLIRRKTAHNYASLQNARLAQQWKILQAYK